MQGQTRPENKQDQLQDLARSGNTVTPAQDLTGSEITTVPARQIIEVIDETKDTSQPVGVQMANNAGKQQKSSFSYNDRAQMTANNTASIPQLRESQSSYGKNEAETIKEAPMQCQTVSGSNHAEDNTSYMADDKKYVQQDMFQEKFLTKEARAKHRLIGQLFKTYWLIEYDGKFFIMDQHAAHEKVKYEELMENYKNKKIYSQYLMPPAVVTLSAAEIEFLHENMDMFEALGYQIENFGGREFKLNAVPDNLFGLDGRELFIDFIADASSSAKKVTIDAFIHKLSTMACKSAIKGNTEISFKEADALIDQLLKLENPYTCPHGRPTVISMTEAEIEKKFKRIV